MAGRYTLPMAGGNRSSTGPPRRGSRRSGVTMTTGTPLQLLRFTSGAAGTAVFQSPFFSPQSSSLFGLSQHVIFEVEDVEYKEGHTGTRYGSGNCDRWRIAGVAEGRELVSTVCAGRMGEPAIGSTYHGVVAPNDSAVQLTELIDTSDRIQMSSPPDMIQVSTWRGVRALVVAIMSAALAVISGVVVIRLFFLGYVSRWGRYPVRSRLLR